MIKKIKSIIVHYFDIITSNYEFNKHVGNLKSICKTHYPKTNNTNKPVLILTGTHMERRGMMGNLSTFTEWVYYALIKQYDLSIDLKYCYNGIINKEDIGKTDGWELFFKQPFNIPIDEALNRKNKIFVETHGKSGIVPFQSPKINEINIPKIDFDNAKTLEIWKSLTKQTMNFNATTLNYSLELFNSIIPQKEKVLGVLLRGTDYILLEPYAHPRQPTSEQAFDKINELCRNEKIKYIFLATEDYIIYKNIKDSCDKIGIKVIINPNSDLFELNDKEQLITFYQKNNIDLYKTNLNYLANIFILSKCYSFLSGSTSATKFIRLLNRINADNNECSIFNSEYIFDLGHYRLD